MLIAFLAKTYNLELPYTTDQISQAVITIAGVVGFFVALYGRWRKGDITILGFRKTQQDKLNDFLK